MVGWSPGVSEAIDFNKIRSKSYKVWRILQAPGVWGQVYRDRESRFANYASAIIFPEQLLGLNQSQLFSVELSSEQNAKIVQLRAIEIPQLVLGTSVPQDYRSIYEWEGDNNGDAALKEMTIGRLGTHAHVLFWNRNLFTNKKDAIKMAARHLEKF
jgi:hypothetical protein